MHPLRRYTNNLLRTIRPRWLGQILDFEDHPYLQTAAWTDGNLLAIAQVIYEDLEAVAAGARVVVELGLGIEGHVLV